MFKWQQDLYQSALRAARTFDTVAGNVVRIADSLERIADSLETVETEIGLADLVDQKLTARDGRNLAETVRDR